jgi:hypothetical protein
MTLLLAADLGETVDVYRGSELQDAYGFRKEVQGTRVAQDVACTIQPALRAGDWETPPSGEYSTKQYIGFFLTGANVQDGDNLYRASTSEWFLVEHVSPEIDPADGSVDHLLAELSVPSKPNVEEAGPEQ